ncbi:MAG: Uncharacterized MFS-type transporter [uncultured Thermomicrobiales bacterium]|uniref:Uncharacterized MFS-type transporter n=1 Tax=uncultured Thermomicrobiales bacterium TaxID=1645740 RepID=A0A6J4UPY0_9BACT|nr:MAG: Uncharacterized MFS-type transporter [uncultured Thermomicrobiales bacterium]
MRTGAGRPHYAWVIVAVTCLALVVAAGVRSAPGVLIVPLEEDQGWRRSGISLAISVGLVLFGLGGPVGGWITSRVGPRSLMIGGLALIVLSTATGAAVQSLWQFGATWGVLSGLGTGMVGAVLGATVANRWFVERRGLVLGAFGAATSAGQLMFVPLLVWLFGTIGWRGGSLVLAAIAAALLIPAFLLMRDDPESVGLRPFGAPEPDRTDPRPATMDALPPAIDDRDDEPVMRRARRSPEFWLLAGTFFICGATSNGLIGIHFIPHSVDHGVTEATAATALAMMGLFNFVGTLGSGWLTDRYDPRRLLATYYTFRGLSLFLLPTLDGFPGLGIFAVLFGLDYIATVPPTAALAADRFGRKHVGIVYGWIFFAHQMGAAGAAWLGGVSRDVFGDYTLAFLAGGTLAVLGGLLSLRIGRERRPDLQLAPA